MALALSAAGVGGVRLIARNGYDFSKRLPLILAAIADLQVRSCVIDGEAVACDENGLSAFEMIDGDSTITPRRCMLLSHNRNLIFSGSCENFAGQ